jgi:hypothetical protein
MQSTFGADSATVVFNPDDWARLMMICGYASGACRDDREFFCVTVRFINALNKGNPKFTPFEVPAE